MTIFGIYVCGQASQMLDFKNVVQVDADDEGGDRLHLLRGSYQHQPQEQGGHTTSNYYTSRNIIIILQNYNNNITMTAGW